MDNWENRSSIVANLFNPAFCGKLITCTIDSYNRASKKGFPFILLPIILPIILHNKTRDLMPSRSDASFYKWVNENQIVFIGFSDRIGVLNQFTKESLMFLLLHNVININAEGLLASKWNYTSSKYKSYLSESQFLQKSKMLGSWLGTIDNPKTVYMFLKIRP